MELLAWEVNFRVVCGQFGQKKCEGCLVIVFVFSVHLFSSNIMLTMESYRNAVAQGVMQKAKNLCRQHGDVSNYFVLSRVKWSEKNHLHFESVLIYESSFQSKGKKEKLITWEEIKRHDEG